MGAFKTEIWDLLEKKKDLSKNSVADYMNICEIILDNMWLLNDRIHKEIGIDVPLDPSKRVILVFYWRNLLYLVSAYLLAIRNLCSASRNIQRTILETIVRGYLYIVNDSIAEKMFIYTFYDIGDKIDNDFRIEMERDTLTSLLNREWINKEYVDIINRIIREELTEVDEKYLNDELKQYWYFDRNVEMLYTKSRGKKLNKLYSELSRMSHSSVRGIYHDINYSKPQVEDCLLMILRQAYGTLQMFIEEFYEEFKSKEIRDFIKDTMLLIVEFCGNLPSLEPNKTKLNKKIRFKKGNFESLLSQ
jgi:hypothetical protein